ncbi:hypothetical protein LZ554_009014 [Drepanopeziza brunnea f. sp. 'monogermtubi']|nr:hypothetical protein LZ554_009014 [Drepanopeziza brunnea f. sp. 'monogermtubi']
MPEDEVQTHLTFMREALAMAELALQTSETPVGCVFVYNGRIIGRGMNATNRTYNGTRHAEFIAINDILTAPHPSEKGRKIYGPEENERAPEPRGKKERVLKLEVEPIGESTACG